MQVAQLPALRQILAGFVGDRSSAIEEVAASCRLLADLSLVPGFCEGFADEIPDVVSRIAARLEKDSTNTDKRSKETRSVSSISTSGVMCWIGLLVPAFGERFAGR
jgi:hypothetical protein